MKTVSIFIIILFNQNLYIFPFLVNRMADEDQRPSKWRYLKVGALVSGLAGSFPGCNYLFHHNTYVDTSYDLILKKNDGLLGYSEMKLPYDPSGKNSGGLTIDVTSPFTYKTYYDFDRDGTLDQVNIRSFSISGPTGDFTQKTNEKTHPEIFQEENKLYQQHLREFVNNFKSELPAKVQYFGLDKLVLK